MLYIEKKIGNYKQKCILSGRITGYLWGGILSNFMFTFLCFLYLPNILHSYFGVFKVKYHFLKLTSHKQALAKYTCWKEAKDPEHQGTRLRLAACTAYHQAMAASRGLPILHSQAA